MTWPDVDARCPECGREWVVRTLWEDCVRDGHVAGVTLEGDE